MSLLHLTRFRTPGAVERFALVILMATAATATDIRHVKAADEDLDANMRTRCPAYVAWLKAHPSAALAPLDPVPPDYPPTDPLLRAELLQMAKADQDARARIHPGAGLSESAVRNVYSVDANNLAWLKLITALTGFPTAAEVGRDGVGALWLLVQHADADLEFQTRALEELQPLAAQGDLGRDSIAMLTDRVRLARGEAQVYGTQFLIDKGVFAMRLTEDVDHVEERRRSVGLPPLAYYECALRVIYGGRK
jgi:hypothetical protein